MHSHRTDAARRTWHSRIWLCSSRAHNSSLATHNCEPTDNRKLCTVNPKSITVRVPATSANLGPGFDSLGLALAITQDVTLSLNYDAAQDGGGLARLVVEAARSAYRLAHVPVPDELKATADNTIPIARGLGASA